MVAFTCQTIKDIIVLFYIYSFAYRLYSYLFFGYLFFLMASFYFTWRPNWCEYNFHKEIRK